MLVHCNLAYSSCISVNLEYTEFSVNSGNIISLEFKTDYCNPPSTIIWYIGDKKVSCHINFTIDTNNSYLSRTTSVLQYTVVPNDPGKLMFCIATNIKGHTVESSKTCPMSDVSFPD